MNIQWVYRGFHGRCCSISTNFLSFGAVNGSDERSGPYRSALHRFHLPLLYSESNSITYVVLVLFRAVQAREFSISMNFRSVEANDSAIQSSFRDGSLALLVAFVYGTHQEPFKYLRCFSEGGDCTSSPTPVQLMAMPTRNPTRRLQNHADERLTGT